MGEPRLTVAKGQGRGGLVQPGSQVTIRYSSGRWQEVRIRADSDRTTLPALDIPADCPMAIALLGKRAGDRLILELAPDAVIAFTVVRVV